MRALGEEFDFDLFFVRDRPRLRPERYDLLYVFFWGETYQRRFGFAARRTVKGLSSHRWEDDPRYGPVQPALLASRHLRDCAAALCTSRRLHDRVRDLMPAYWTPNGFDPDLFRPLGERSGPMVVGWAGNAKHALKGLDEVLQPACEGRFTLRLSSGERPHAAMNDFYNGVDVFAVASRHEGEPLTLIEAMAAGCFPVSADVGIAKELIRSGDNGLVVEDRTAEAFREAFGWCETHLERVRRAGMENARRLHEERRWPVAARRFAQAFREVIAAAGRPRFRNDDVGWDTPVARFREFCEVFHRHGLIQVHGVTLRGRTAAVHSHAGQPTEYEGQPNLSVLDNERIRRLAAGERIEDRTELVDLLRTLPDEVAIHGLYHTDYSRMSSAEQENDIREALELLERLLPGKRVRWFGAPFNRTNRSLEAVCRDLGLELLGGDGVHLEAELAGLRLRADTWHRYHHHRFYPESSFRYYRLTLADLDSALGRALAAGIAEAPPPSPRPGLLRRLGRRLSPSRA